MIFFQRADKTMPITHPGSNSPEDSGKEELLKYGELVILGYNGSLPQGDKGRRRSKFVLYLVP